MAHFKRFQNILIALENNTEKREREKRQATNKPINTVCPSYSIFILGYQLLPY
jgi:hypothetical protein